jgi:hypothetical protein
LLAAPPPPPGPPPPPPPPPPRPSSSSSFSSSSSSATHGVRDVGQWVERNIVAAPLNVEVMEARGRGQGIEEQVGARREKAERVKPGER